MNLAPIRTQRAPTATEGLDAVSFGCRPEEAASLAGTPMQAEILRKLGCTLTLGPQNSVVAAFQTGADDSLLASTLANATRHNQAQMSLFLSNEGYPRQMSSEQFRKIFKILTSTLPVDLTLTDRDGIEQETLVSRVKQLGRRACDLTGTIVARLEKGAVTLNCDQNAWWVIATGIIGESASRLKGWSEDGMYRGMV